MSMPGARRSLEAIRRALFEPANNLHVSGVITFVAACFLLIAALIIDSKGVFLLVAAPTIVVALSLIWSASRTDTRPLDALVARKFGRTTLALLPTSPTAPNTLAVLLYCLGVMGSAAGYGYLALTSSSVGEDIRWGLLDKRPIVFGYLIVGAFVAFHWAVVGSFFGRQSAGRPTPSIEIAASGFLGRASVRWTLKALGGAFVAFLAYCLIALPALRAVSTGIRHRRPVDGRGLADFYDLHAHVHLGAFEQIRLGATPYLEAETQYGLGNQVLMYFLTSFVNFSNHGFFAANILLNAVCIVAFFIILQQFLGLGWASLGLLGWLLLPSPYIIADFAGWAILTRWLAIPILSLLFAYLLLKADPTRRTWVGPLLAGVIWGTGSFLSQENLSGGLLVFALSLALFGPVSGLQLRGIARFSALFLASGTLALVASVATFVGLSRCLEVFRLANTKSSLVMAGLSNSLWSENLELSATFIMVNGRLQSVFGAEGIFAPLLQTYGFAILLMVAVALLAGFLGRRWYAAGERDRAFVRKFAGVTVGAYVLHLFTLLRSDFTHLYGPSVLLPIFLVMLPLFVWRCVRPGVLRGALLVISLGVILEAAIAGRFEIGRRIDKASTVWSDSTAVLQTYRDLRNLRQEPPDLAARYSPTATFQDAFRNHRDFDETKELFGLLRERLRGRRVELGFYRVSELIDHPELFYFFGGFRSVSGITSPTNSIWLRSEENAWVDKVVNAESACVFFESDADTKLFEAWKKSAPPGTVVTEPIVGKRLYGILSCKT
ncbi:MAG: hypothetical protein Q8N31_00070 [Reyranella sp.]|nr:hypothetical protein [Reyranella sp.]